MLESFTLWAVPALYRVHRPLRRLVGMAGIAGVRRPELDREVRPGNAQGVIVARVDDHVGSRRHVAGGAADRRIDALVPAMRGDGVFVGGVALQADAVARQFELGAVRIVAVAAGDAFGEHLALLERPVIVDFVLHLPVGEIEAVAQGRRRSGCPTAIVREPSLPRSFPRRA